MARLRKSGLASTLLICLTPQDSQACRNWRHGRNSHRWPDAFMGNIMDGGAFRPFRLHNPKGGGAFTNGSPLYDIFQEVAGDVTKVARELTESRFGTLTRTPRHEVFETAESVTLNIDLPGCKKQDVDAQISEDDGAKTLRITAVRRRPHNKETVGVDGSDGGSRNEGSGYAGAEPFERERSPSVSVPSAEEKFELSFLLGEGIDVSRVRGNMEDGVLTLVLPKVPRELPAQPIDIPIDCPEEGDRRVSPEDAEGPDGGDGGDGGDKGRAANTHVSLS